MRDSPPPSGDDDTLAGTPVVAARPVATAPAIERVGRFVLLRELGRGGMGVVWSAYDPDLDRKVAIKLIRGGEHGLAAARFIREARALAKLNHPQVIQIHDVGIEAGRLWLAMELVPGHTFAELMRGTPLGWQQWLRWSIAAGRGLAAAHAAGLVHRDFKPANVMVADDPRGIASGRVVVLDFGLARAAGSFEPTDGDPEPLADEPLAALTRTADLIGTPAYMAPEQFAHASIDARADQFAFAVTLFEALYGIAPFARDSLVETVHAVTTGAPRTTPSGSRVPRGIDRVLRRALQRDPALRYPSMDALLEQLAAFTPERRRQRGLAIAIAGAAIAAIAWGASRPSAIDPCAELAAGVSRSWDAAAQAGVAAALDRAGLGAPELAAVIANLDGSADDHHQAILESCAVTDGLDASARMQTPRLRCLTRGTLELARTIELLAGADTRIAAEAVVATRHLPAASRCAIEPPSPVDDATLRAAHDADPRLARINTLLRFGRIAEARAETEALAAEIAGLAPAPLHAEVDAMLGDALERDGDVTQAHAVSLRAALGAERFGNDPLFARVAADLAFIEAERLGHLELAELWVQLGFAAVRRTGGATAAELRLHGALASVRASQDRLDEAIDENLAAIELGTQAFGSRDASTLAPRLNLAQALWQRGDWSEAARRYEDAIALAVEIDGERHPTTLSARANLMGLLHQAGDRERVEAIALPLLHALEAVGGPDELELVGVLVSLAQLDDAEGRAAAGARSLQRALALLHTAGEQGVRPTVVAAELALLELHQGDAAAARERIARTRADAPEPFAVELARRALELDWSSAGPAAVREQAEALATVGEPDDALRLTLAEHALALGDREPARTLLQSLRDALPPSATALTGRSSEACAAVLELGLELRIEQPACAQLLLATAEDPLHLRRGLRAARIDRARAARSQGDRAGADALLEAAVRPRAATYDDAVMRARAQLELAESLAPSPRAHELAAQARATFAASGLRHADALARIDALTATASSPR